MSIRQLMRFAAVFFVFVASPNLVVGQEADQQPISLESTPSQASYGIGRQIGGQIGGQLVRDGLDGDLLDIRALLLGVHDALTGADPRITQEQFTAAIGQIEQLARQRVSQRMAEAAEKNRKEGPLFIEKFKALDGVQQTASGLLYQVKEQGTGASPKATDIIQAHFRGMLVDGTEFDNSIKRKEPLVIRANELIPGWTEALQLMKVGDRWRVVIPSNLAYGAKGRPPIIGPDAVLIFDLDLLGIGPPAGQAQPATP